MRTHIKFVAIINILIGGLGVLSALAMLVGGTFGSLMSGHIATALVGTAVNAIIAVLIGLMSAVGLVAGFGLLSGAQWARYTIIVLSVLRLFQFPWMTIFAVYSLWVLLSADGRREFVHTTL